MIQKKVGFELELDLPVSRYVPGEEQRPVKNWKSKVRTQVFNQLTADTQEEPWKGVERVRGHEIVLDRLNTDGWKATVDNTKRLGTHKANLEIVTRPIDTESQDSAQVRRQLKSVIRSAQAWVNNLMQQGPEDNRIRVGNYVVGFAPKTFPTPPNYRRGGISTDAYAQINIGVPMTKVNKLYREASESGNKFNETENDAATKAATLAHDLTTTKGYTNQDEKRLKGFFTLLGAAVLGAQTISPKTLLKKLWSVLPKSGLHNWWKLERLNLSENARALFLDEERCANFVTVFCKRFGVKPKARLLGKYSDETLTSYHNLSKLPVFVEFKSYTVEKYLKEVVSCARDVLVEASLQHRATTGGGTSELPVDSGGGQHLGVMEVRNIFTHWNWDEWYQEAERWAKFAYELTGKNWDADLPIGKAMWRGAMESYEGSLEYRRYMNHFVPEF